MYKYSQEVNRTNILAYYFFSLSLSLEICLLLSHAVTNLIEIWYTDRQ